MSFEHDWKYHSAIGYHTLKRGPFEGVVYGSETSGTYYMELRWSHNGVLKFQSAPKTLKACKRKMERVFWSMRQMCGDAGSVCPGYRRD